MGGNPICSAPLTLPTRYGWTRTRRWAKPLRTFGVRIWAVKFLYDIGNVGTLLSNVGLELFYTPRWAITRAAPGPGRRLGVACATTTRIILAT